MINFKTILYVGFGLAALSSLVRQDPQLEGWIKNFLALAPTTPPVSASSSDNTPGGNRQIIEHRLNTIDRNLGAPTALVSAEGNLAYVAQANDKYRVVWQDTPGAPYDSIAELHFSPDGKHIAYRAVRSGKYLVIRDQQESKEYQAVQRILFSPDSEHLAYEALMDGKWMVVMDDEPMTAHDDLVLGSLLFIPGGDQVAFIRHSGDKFTVIAAGQAGRSFDVIFNLEPLAPNDAGVPGTSYLGLDGNEFWSIEQRIK